MVDRGAFIATMVTLASVAFGVIAALAWHAFVSEALAQVLPADGGLLGTLIYAVIVTVIAILVMVWLGKLAARSGGKSALWESSGGASLDRTTWRRYGRTVQPRRLPRERGSPYLLPLLAAVATGAVIVGVLIGTGLDGGGPEPTPSPTLAAASPTPTPTASPPPTTAPPPSPSPSPSPTPVVVGELPPLPPEPTLPPEARSIANGELAFTLADGETRTVEVSALFEAEGETMPPCAGTLWTTSWSSVHPLRATIRQQQASNEIGVGRWGTTYLGCAFLELRNESGAPTSVRVAYTLGSFGD